MARFLLRRVPIDRQGYERDGTYWGTGAPLFEYETPDGDIDHLRAGSRESAKAKVIAKFTEYQSKPKKKRKVHAPSSQIGGLFNRGRRRNGRD